MVAPLFNPFAHTPAVSRTWHTWDGQQPPSKGQLCFAICLWKPPKWWRPRTLSARPPLWKPMLILSHSFNLPAVLREADDWNLRQTQERKPGKRVSSWAVPVQVVSGFDETARVLEGGGA